MAVLFRVTDVEVRTIDRVLFALSTHAGVVDIFCFFKGIETDA